MSRLVRGTLTVSRRFALGARPPDLPQRVDVVFPGEQKWATFPALLWEYRPHVALPPPFALGDNSDVKPGYVAS